MIKARAQPCNGRAPGRRPCRSRPTAGVGKVTAALSAGWL